jgi:hypothetical protein
VFIRDPKLTDMILGFYYANLTAEKKGESALVLYSKHVYVEREREREREEEEKEKAYLENDDTALLSSSSSLPFFLLSSLSF